MSKCRLCLKKIELSDSHIIPKMFYKNVKRNSVTGKMRSSLDVNKVIQDGVKLPFLCAECEKLFSEYETYFSKKIYQNFIKNSENFEIGSQDNDKIRYFILSVAWRYLKWYYEVMPDESNYTKDEINYIETTLNYWRKFLLDKKFTEICKIQMFLIPYEKINSLNNYTIKNTNGISTDFRSFDNENEFKYSTFFLKVPKLIIMCTIWGETKHMKQFKVGKTIKSKDSKMPNIIHEIFDFLENNFNKSAEELSPVQINKTIERLQKDNSTNKGL